jgi:predicted enzyme related to lactoylglutathione lyase
MSSASPSNNHRIDYIEFATCDLVATKKFFTAAFGWPFTDYGPEYAAFNDGRLSGGFFAAPDAAPTKNPLIVIYAVKLEDAEQRVVRAGGKIVKPAFEFPGGRRFEFADPTGLTLAVWSDTRADGSKVG